MTTRQHAQMVADWLLDLSKLTAGNTPLEDLATRVSAMTSVVADTFPDARCFTRKSLEHIAKQSSFFPSFATLHTQLAAWWGVHRPRSFVPPAELESANLSSADRMAVIVWLHRQAANDLPAHEMRMRLAVLRRHNPGGYRWLTSNNLVAASIAVQEHWATEEPAAAPGDAEREAVAAIVRGVVGTPEPDTPPRQPRPQHLTPEQLKAARAGRQTVPKAAE